MIHRKTILYCIVCLRQFLYKKVIKHDISVHTSNIRVLEYSKEKLFAVHKSFNIPHAFAKRKFKYQPNSIEFANIS